MKRVAPKNGKGTSDSGGRGLCALLVMASPFEALEGCLLMDEIY